MVGAIAYGAGRTTRAEGARAMLAASRQSGPFPIISSIPCIKIFGPGSGVILPMYEIIVSRDRPHVSRIRAHTGSQLDTYT